MFLVAAVVVKWRKSIYFVYVIVFGFALNRVCDASFRGMHHELSALLGKSYLFSGDFYKSKETTKKMLSEDKNNETSLLIQAESLFNLKVNMKIRQDFLLQ